MANLPVTIFKFAMSPYPDWVALAWAGVFLITVGVLALNILARVFFPEQRSLMEDSPRWNRASPDPPRHREAELQIGTSISITASFTRSRTSTWTFPRRRVTAFIGPSGCGKSTLLRAINRMYDLYPEQRVDGEMLLDGKNMLMKDDNLTDLRARVGMVFQKPTPFPMSIYDNIAFGVKLHERLSKSEWTSGWNGRSTRPRCGERSRTSSSRAA